MNIQALTIVHNAVTQSVTFNVSCRSLDNVNTAWTALIGINRFQQFHTCLFQGVQRDTVLRMRESKETADIEVFKIVGDLGPADLCGVAFSPSILDQGKA